MEEQKTREELILSGDLTLLKEGEKVINGEIILIPVPAGMDNPHWNKDTKQWYEKRDVVLLKRYERKVVETQELLDRYSRSGFDTTKIEKSLNEYKEQYNILKNELNL